MGAYHRKMIARIVTQLFSAYFVQEPYTKSLDHDIKQPTLAPRRLYLRRRIARCVAREIKLLRQRADVQRLCLVDISLAIFQAESIGQSKQTLQEPPACSLC